MNRCRLSSIFKPASKLLALCIFVIFFSASLYSQTLTNGAALLSFASEKHLQFLINRAEVEEYARQNNIPVRQELPDGMVMEIHHLEKGKPVYYMTTNLGAAATTRADELWPGASMELGLTGSGYDKIGIWDAGKVRNTHQEFGSPTRVTQKDTATIFHQHSTHVAGTMVAAGVDANAKGMAYESKLDAYEWNDDEAEMATAGATGMEVSNHSYGFTTGWNNNYWWGDLTVNTDKDYMFGFYSSATAEWDEIAYNAPYYLIVKAAGNDRDDNWTGDHYHWDYIADDWVWSSDSHDPDGNYDCIITKSTAKNILTVGAVEEVSNYNTPSDVDMSTFSSWGPADDGRIKPDIVAKGVSVYSTRSSSDANYGYGSGTSMSSPNVTGTLALLQQHYQNRNSGSPMRSATLKGLAIHTADEAGDYTGPDYEFGWGLLNAQAAANLINLDSYGNNVIDEQVLSNSGTYTRTIRTDGTRTLKVTICWTDPRGTPPPSSLNPRTAMLVNDLDLKITENGSTYYPWKMDYNNPANAATNTGKNYVDNVEQVYIASPPNGDFIIEVSHDGTLQGGNQAFSIIVSGNNVCTPGTIIYNTDTEDYNFCEDGMWVKKRNTP